MSFIDNPSNDPMIRRAERISRLGSMIPALGWALINLLLVLSSFVVTLPVDRAEYVLLVAVIGLAGQIVVWVGMIQIRRIDAWDCGINSYLWSGGLLTSLVIGGTLMRAGALTDFAAALIPWIAPVTATVAKRRMARARRV